MGNGTPVVKSYPAARGSGVASHFWWSFPRDSSRDGLRDMQRLEIIMTKYPSTKEARSQNDEKHLREHTQSNTLNYRRLQPNAIEGKRLRHCACSDFVIRISFGLGYFVIRH